MNQNNKRKVKGIVVWAEIRSHFGYQYVEVVFLCLFCWFQEAVKKKKASSQNGLFGLLFTKYFFFKHFYKIAEFINFKLRFVNLSI